MQTAIANTPQTSVSTDEHLRLKQAASYLNVSPVTLWRLAEREAFFPKKIKLGRKLCFYRKSDLDAWLKSREVSA
jgi:prophage regulatory protein